MSHGLLRFVTAGSVDDGKSTLIGRLLFDTSQIADDQMEHVEKTSRDRGDGYLNLALLTDGLRAEREQGITIDVAYRYFESEKRNFVVADVPGHVQYTRNMVTGATLADAAVLLVDARHGVTEQTRRHLFITRFLRTPHVAVCVNKMDMVDWSRDRFDEVASELTELADWLGLPDLEPIPIAALHGDNVVTRSEHTPWNEHPPLLEWLETIEVARDKTAGPARMPVQWVIRPNSDEHPDYRGYAGQVAGGVLRAGDEIAVLPSGRRSRIKAIDTLDGELDEAVSPLSVTVLLEDDIDVSRGDMITAADSLPTETRELEAEICWMDERPLEPGRKLLLKHTTNTVQAVVDELIDRVELEQLRRTPAPERYELNDIGKVRLRTSAPLLTDPYIENHTTGAFILIDEGTNATVAGGAVI